MIKPLCFLLLFTTRSFSRISPSVQLYFSLYFCSPKSQLFGWRLRKLVGGNVVYVSEHILFSSFSIDKAPTTHCVIHLSIHQTSSDYIIFEFLCWDCKDHKKKKNVVWGIFPMKSLNTGIGNIITKMEWELWTSMWFWNYKMT